LINRPRFQPYEGKQATFFCLVLGLAAIIFAFSAFIKLYTREALWGVKI